MTHQHREFQSWLDDSEKLRPYAQSAIYKHQALDASLAKAKSKLKHWELEAKVGSEKITRMEKERDEAKQEAKVARLAASATGDARARVKKYLARVKEALAATEEGRHKAEAGTTRLEVERTSLLLELEAAKMRCPPSILRW